MVFQTIRGFLAASAALVALPAIADAGTFQTIYTFESNSGVAPEAPLIASNGVLYGTTSQGGPSNAGLVFSFDLQTGAETVLTSSMGALPYTPVLAMLGRLYGTTSAAANGQGNIFEYDLKTGKTKDLYDFPRGPDLADPTGLVQVGTVIYGVAVNGGSLYNGSIFKYDVATGTFTTLYTFTGNADGKNPTQLLYRGGALYGVTLHGGANGIGTLFKLDLGTNTETVLHNFAGAADGSWPNGIAYYFGHIYGTAMFGGANGSGTLFKLDPATNALSVVYNFAGGAGGCVPFGAPVFYKGRFYGAAASCGDAANQGTLYSITLSSGKLETLHTFSNGPDGVSPGGSLLLNQGVIYGTASFGGANNAGTIFSYTP
jgi:uncharacterized repeat protein (TIGR03803 family)